LADAGHYAFAVTANVAIAMLMRRPHASSVTAGVTEGACAGLLISIPAVYYLLVRTGSSEAQAIARLIPRTVLNRPRQSTS
jgi:hypothetical protein